MQKSSHIHPDLLEAQMLLYQSNGLTLHNLIEEKESQEYGACTFEMNNQRIAFRAARITPTKIGQFVTFWKRIGAGPILPYDISDPFDILVISARNTDFLGQFIFPKAVLLKHDVISQEHHGGKRALRVYPPWDVPESRQAQNTQTWQLMHFVEIKNNAIDTAKIRALFA